MSHTSRWLRSPLVPASVAAVAAVALISAWTARDDASGSDAKPPTQAAVLQASERVQSNSTEDWASVADAVALVHVTGERRIEQPKSETATGEGEDLVGREVSVTVDDVLWSSRDSDRVPSGTLTMGAAGWLSDGEVSREVVLAQGSRIEPGHSYVMALTWMRAECDEGDPDAPARWASIGSGGVLPADDGLVGRGEYLGSPSSKLDAADLPEGSILAETLGRRPEAVAALVDKSSQVERIDIQANVSRCEG